MDMTFEDYYKQIGLAKYPFGVFMSEGEREVFDEIYLPPQMRLPETFFLWRCTRCAEAKR